MGKYHILDDCEKRNVMMIESNSEVMEKEEYKPKIQTLPRTKEKIYIPPKDKINKR